jgi:WD40 repeat protein
MHDAAKVVGVYDLETGQELRRFQGLRAWPEGFVLSKDGLKLATSDPSASPIVLWDVASGRKVRELTGHRDGDVPHLRGVHVLAISPDGKQLLSAGADKTIRLWDVERGREIRQLAYPENDVTALALSPDGKIAVASGNIVQLWDTVP